MKKSLIPVLILLSAGLALAQDKGLSLGEEEYFSGNGNFTITVNYKDGGVNVDIPSSIVVDRFVVYRSTSAAGPFRKVGITREYSFKDDKIDGGTTYFYVVAGLRKVKQNWEKVYSGAASIAVPAEEPATSNQTESGTTGAGTTGAGTTGTGTTEKQNTDNSTTQSGTSGTGNTGTGTTEKQKSDNTTTGAGTTGTGTTGAGTTGAGTSTEGTKTEDKKPADTTPPPQNEPVPVDTMVNINSTPAGALVKINGQPSGSTPLQVKLNFGSYRISLEKTGFKTWMNPDFGVTFGQKVSADIDLERIKAAVNITTVPDGASIRINGQIKGNSPLNIPDLEFGDYRISAEMKGYMTSEKQIRVESEAPQSVNLVLQNEGGGVRILSTPAGAVVLVDNINKGVTPVSLAELPAGIHSLQLSKNGYSRLIQEFTVETGIVKDLAFTLQQQIAYLTVTTSPDSADIVLDNAAAGKSPLSMFAIAVGAHNLVVHKEGFQDYTEVFTAAVDQVVKREIVLSTKPVTLIVNSVPERVRIFINGRDYGYTPFLSANLTPGNYVLSLQREGFYSLTNRISMTPDSKKELVLILKPLPSQVPPVTPAVENGSLSVLTVPNGAEISINAMPKGRAPFITSLLPGNYTITVSKTNYVSQTVAAVVESGKARNLELTLTRAMTRLTVNSVPDQAVVFIDSIQTGLTPLSLDIASGDHVLKIGKAGMKSVSETLSVTATNRQITRSYNLQPEAVKFAFTSIPSGAEVYVDGKMLGLTPLEIPHSGSGTYAVVFHKAGYRDAKYNLVITAGQPQSLNAVLEAPVGSLLIRSNPVADFFLDGAFKGKTGSLQQVAIGIHKATLKAYGYYDFETQVKITENKLTTNFIKLTEKPK